MNKILPLIINLSESQFLAALAKSLNVINPENQKKVLQENLTLSALQNYFQQTLPEISWSNSLPEAYNSDEETSARRELFSVNYLSTQGLYLQIINVPSLLQKEISLEVRLFSGPNAPDFYLPVYLDPETRQAHFFGYFTREQVESFAFLFSESFSKIATKYLKPLTDLKNDLLTVERLKPVAEDLPLSESELGEIIETFQEQLALFEIPEEYISKTDFLSDRLYQSLLKSDRYSNLYLQTQLIFKKMLTADGLEKLVHLTVNLLLFYQKNNQDLQNFVSGLAKVYPDFYLPEFVPDLLSETDKIHQNLKEEVKNEISPADRQKHWFVNQLTELLQFLSDDQSEELLKAIKSSFNRIIAPFIAEKETEKPLTRLDFKQNKFKIVREFGESLEIIALSSLPEINHSTFAFSLPRIEFIADYFGTEMGSEAEKQFKTLLTLVTIIVREKGLFPQIIGKNPQQLSLIVDLAFTFSKLVYQLSRGEINSSDAHRYFQERYQAVLLVLLKQTVKSAEPNDLIGNIEAVFSPSGVSPLIIFSLMICELFIQEEEIILSSGMFAQALSSLREEMNETEIAQSFLAESAEQLNKKNELFE